jgi:branched-chain amino acid transport system permease protein
MQFQDQRVYAMLALALLVAAMLAALRVERSRFGLSLLAIKQNEPAAEAAGIDSLKWKLRAIVLSGAMASAAGGLYAVVILVLTPASVFGVIVSSQALVLALSGGVGTVWGPLIGAAVLVPLAEVLHGELGHILPGIQGVVYGLAVILVILAAPEGVYWKVRDWLVKTGRVPPSPALAIGSVPRVGLEPRPLLMNPQDSPSRQGSEEPLLELRGVTRSFGGLQALQGVSFKVPAGALQGIIGPNGSGKTTLFNVLNGFLPPDGGEMLFRGEPLGGLKPNRICRLGIARTFQVVRVFPRLSALQNAMIGALVATRSDDEAEALAMAAVERVGLKQRAHILAGVLTNKERRLMELARALASRPRLILMDETLAGLSRQETDEMLELLQGLNRDGLTIVIIEHTMHAMVRLADNFIVLDHGRMVTEGKPEDVVRDKRVIEAYLGKKWMDRVSH